MNGRISSTWLLALVVAVSTVASYSREDTKFRINFGSCHDVREPRCNEESMKIWDSITARNGNLWIWGGDNVYADTRPRSFGGVVRQYVNLSQPIQNFRRPLFTPASPTTIRELYGKLATIPQYKNFVKSIGKENIVGIWDDHDFGHNDAEKNYSWKEESQQAFLDFFDVPKESPRRKRHGVYSFHDANQGKVRIIMLDNRYHRDDYSNKTGDFLGEDQWKWLEDTLASSKAKINVIVSGVQVFPIHPLRSKYVVEVWNRFPAARARLLNTIVRSQAKGVMLISGDVHYAELMMANCTCTEKESKEKIPFHVPEFTASGMTHSWAKPRLIRAFLQFFFESQPLPFRVENKYFLGKNFAELDLDLVENDLGSSTIEYRCFDMFGQVHLKHKLNLAELKSFNTEKVDLETCECVPYGGNVSKSDYMFRIAVFIFTIVLMVLLIFIVVLKLVKLLWVLLYKMVEQPFAIYFYDKEKLE